MQIDELVDAVAGIAGVTAVVLGGSRARGLETAGSDTDLGLFYRDEAPIDLGALRALAHEVDASHPEVTELYGWGPWVNGGCWLTLAGGERVDLIYRSVEQVERVLRELSGGRREHHWNQQPPFGFTSVVYGGEVAACRILHDPHGEIARLKQLVGAYPDALRRAVVTNDMSLANFTIETARKPAFRDDPFTTMGHLTRAAYYLTQVLFALNRTWFVNEKSAMREIATFDLHPSHWDGSIALALVGAAGLIEKVETMADLHRSVALLVASSDLAP